MSEWQKFGDVEVPDGRAGAWRIETFEVSEIDHQASVMLAAIKRDALMVVRPGTYKRLVREGYGTVMSNTDMERITHAEPWRRARGRVLINGLGLGMLASALVRKPVVDAITIIEREPDVIELAGPTFARWPQVRIIEADALEFRPAKGERFGAVWHDIWDGFSSDNLPEMRLLHRRYGRHADWQGSWGRELID